jgi:uncharacterized protein DUF885
MRVRAFLAAVLCAFLAPLPSRGALPQSVGVPIGDAQFEATAERFVAESEARDPLFADGIGVHAYDDALPDYSAAGLAARDAWLASWRTLFGAVDPFLLSRPVQADRVALLDTIDLETYENATIAPWHNDPDRYVEAIGTAVYALTGRTYAPAVVRYGHVAQRLAAVPALADAAIANLRRPPRVLTQFAIDQNAGNIALYRGLPAAAHGLPAGLQQTIRSRTAVAVARLERLQAFLKGPLLGRSDGNPRVGAAVFDRELVLADGTDVPRAELLARARAAMNAQRAEMLRLALPYDRRFFPHASRNYSGDALIDRVVRRVLDRLGSDHPKRDAVFATAKADVASLMAFLRTNPVVPLPVPDTLHVVPTPAFMAGFGGASLDPPGPFTPLAESYFYIDRIPAAWSHQRVASYLREYNNYEMKMLSMHEAVPGHYVQFRYNNALPSIVRRVFGNGSFVEGWAVWTEGMMLNAGYGGGDPRLRLFQLKWRLREESNAIIDAEFHAGSLTKAQCVDFIVRKAFQERAEAETKWHRLNVSHDQLSSYFVGLDAIQRGRQATRSRYGLAAFNRRLLDMGDVEPRFIAGML